MSFRLRTPVGDQIVSRRGTSFGIDQGLRSFFEKVYSYMGMGLGVSGLVAYLTAHCPPLVRLIFYTPFFWVAILSPLVLVMTLRPILNKCSAKTAVTAYFLYSSVMGLSLSSIFLVYQHQSIVSLFATSAVMFLGMSLYGYSAKKDLAAMGSFLRMGIFGVITVIILNLFLKNSILSLGVSFIAVVIFTGLTAHDIQMLRRLYETSDEKGPTTKLAILGALHLYLDFVNIFVHLLNLLGRRR